MGVNDFTKASEIMSQRSKYDIRFHCLTCEKMVDMVEQIPTVDKIGQMRLTCHGHYESVVPPWWTIHEWENPIFVVGLRGPWKVALHDPSLEGTTPEVGGQFSGPPLGRFEQEDLIRLFTPGPAGIPQKPLHYGYHSQFYDIIHTGEDIRFPAEHWFPPRHELSKR